MEEPDKHEAVRSVLTLPDAPKRGRARLVGVAMKIFYTRGISPVGLDEIIAECGVTKTTFYKHFRSKTELVVAAIEARDEWARVAWREAVEILAGPDPRDQLVGMFEVLDLLFNTPAFRGCHFINAVAEFPNPHDPIHRAAARHKHANYEWFLELAEGAGMCAPETFVDAYSILYEGVLVLRQVGARSDAARVAIPQVNALLEQFTPASASASA